MIWHKREKSLIICGRVKSPWCNQGCSDRVTWDLAQWIERIFWSQYNQRTRSCSRDPFSYPWPLLKPDCKSHSRTRSGWERGLFRPHGGVWRCRVEGLSSAWVQWGHHREGSPYINFLRPSCKEVEMSEKGARKRWHDWEHGWCHGYERGGKPQWKQWHDRGILKSVPWNN